MTVTKEQWVAALRSGQYKQCTDARYRDKKGKVYFGTYDASKVASCCAIGVLGAISNNYDGSEYVLADLLLGKPESARGQSPSNSIIILNDIELKTFEEIADFIESYEWKPPKTYLG